MRPEYTNDSANVDLFAESQEYEILNPDNYKIIYKKSDGKLGGNLPECIKTVFAITLATFAVGLVLMLWNSAHEPGNTVLTETRNTVTQMDEAN